MMLYFPCQVLKCPIERIETLIFWTERLLIRIRGLPYQYKKGEPRLPFFIGVL